MSDALMTILMLALIVVVFWLFLIRPQNKKKKQEKQMREALKVGDVVTTIGGVVGTVCSLKEETMVLEVGADRVRIEFSKWALSSIGAQTSEAPAKS